MMSAPSSILTPPAVLGLAMKFHEPLQGVERISATHVGLSTDISIYRASAVRCWDQYSHPAPTIRRLWTNSKPRRSRNTAILFFALSTGSNVAGATRL